MSVYQTINPANNKLIRSWPAHDKHQVEEALDTASKLYQSE